MEAGEAIKRWQRWEKTRGCRDDEKRRGGEDREGDAGPRQRRAEVVEEEVVRSGW